MIRTEAQLITYIKELVDDKTLTDVLESNYPKTPRDAQERLMVKWFIAMQHVIATSEDRLKDRAALFMHGIPPMTTDGVEEYLQTLFDPEEWEDDKVAKQAEREATMLLDDAIRKHFGVK